jgi:ribosome-associated protein
MVRRRGPNAARLQEDDNLSLDIAAAGAAPMGAMKIPAPTPVTSDAILSEVIASLEDDKAEGIVQIDLRGRSSMGDWMVIASGRSSRQVAAISEKLMDRLKQKFGIVCRIEGKEAGDWVLIDSGDVIVHVFRPEVREFYQLEKMWMPTGAERAEAEATTGRPQD